MGRRGFTLLEVLLALLIITGGLLILMGALGPITRLASEGRERGRIALALESRIEWVRAEVHRGACRPPGSGTTRWPDGVIESWSSVSRPGSIEILITALMTGRQRAPDSVLSRISCP